MQVYFVTITESFIFNPLIFVSTQKDVAYIHTYMHQQAYSFSIFIPTVSFSSALI